MNDKTDILKPINRVFNVWLCEGTGIDDMNENTVVGYNMLDMKQIHEIYEHIDEIHENDKDYFFTNLTTDDNWAIYSEIIDIDDIVMIARKIMEMNDFEYTAFKTIMLERIHEPLDVVKHILSNGIEVKKAHHNDDEIEFWEEFTMLGQQFIIPYQF